MQAIMLNTYMPKDRGMTTSADNSPFAFRLCLFTKTPEQRIVVFVEVHVTVRVLFMVIPNLLCFNRASQGKPL